MKNYLLLLALTLLTGPPARAQWVLQPYSFASTLAPLPPFNSQAIYIVDAQTVWTVGVSQYMGTNYGANEVARTSNGGATWTVSTVPGMDFLWEIISNAAGLSASTALICTVNAMGPGRIMKTTDGGTTWTTQSTATQYGSADSYADFVLAFSSTELLCVGDPIASLSNRFEMYRSTDAGLTWTGVATGNMPAALSGETATPYYKARVGNHVWFSTNRGRVFHSADKGLSWTVSQTSLTGIAAVAFRDALNGLAFLPGGGGLVRTTDGGATWAAVAYTGPAHAKLTAVPGTNNYLSAGEGPDAGSSFSRDNGTTWTAIESTLSHFDVAAFSPTVAWSAAVSYTNTAYAGLGAYKLTSTVLGTTAATAAPPPPLQVFPNPSADGRFTLALPAGASAESLTVLDALGRVVLTQPQLPTGATELDLRAQAPGFYTLLVRTGRGAVRQQLVRQ
jgi:photosystem II stability/assembly factor-like uncharacterized protein